MTPAGSWHPGDEVLQAYVDGRASSSVEAHLLSCADCRAAVIGGVPPQRLAGVRNALLDRVDALERPRLERLLLRLGLQVQDVRALLAAPALRAAWCGAVIASIALTVIVLQSDHHVDALFLLLAPLLPMCTTAVAYAPGLDPALPHVAATPYSTTRLLLARSLSVGATAFVGTTLASVALPDGEPAAVVWMLPALALTLLALTLSLHVGAAWAGAVVSTGWVGFAALLRSEGVDLMDVLGAGGQVVFALLAATAALALLDQQKHIDEGGTA